MSLACKPKNISPTYEELLTQQTTRNLGLSSVFNVNTYVSPCVEDFTSPTYYLSGATKPMTGLTITSDSTHNMSEVDDFDLIYNFTGSTDYTGYTGEFCYEVVGVLPANLIADRCTPFSGLTGSTLVTNYDNTEVSTVDNEYITKSWVKFNSKCVTGLTIDTSDYEVDFSVYDYFVTVTNPPKPSLLESSSNVFSDLNFVSEIIPVTFVGMNSFLLNEKPLGSIIILNVNGVNVVKSDYSVDPTTNVVTLLNGITFEIEDVVQVYYNKTNLTNPFDAALNNRIKMDMFLVTGITTGVTSSFSATTYDNFVNYNNTNNRLEVFLTEDIESTVQPIVTINGVNVLFNVDVYKSNVVKNKLIFSDSVSILAGDVISIYYYFSGLQNPGDLGMLKTDSPAISWSSQQNITRNASSSGEFTVEVAEKGDTTFSTILYTGSTSYDADVTSYSLSVGPITTTSITNYIYRIKFTKDYVTSIIMNTYQTTNYSDIGSFILDWNYINNTNF
jgi:hypothetical protein